MSPEYHMANENVPDHCKEIMGNKEAQRNIIRNAALFQASVHSMYMDEFYLFGEVSQETKDKANEAGKRYNDAIRGMLANNGDLRDATH